MSGRPPKRCPAGRSIRSIRPLPRGCAKGFVMSDRLPLFIVTGFLGSGKTTLVQRFLREPGGQGTGVVVNEFGETGLDHRLMVHAAENVELIGNGCMCCARRDDVGRALYD